MGEYRVGDHVLLSRNRTGVIRYAGEPHFAKGFWYGLELDLGYTGKNDGSVGGERYFDCPAAQGLFLQHNNIRGIAPDTHKLKQKKIPSEVTSSTSLKKEDHVTLNDGRTGKIQYIGRVKHLKGTWYGLRLDPGHAGKNDGSFKGYRYFKCPKGQGLFVTRKRVKSKLSSPRSTSRSRKAAAAGENSVAAKKISKKEASVNSTERSGRPRNREPMRSAKANSKSKHKPLVRQKTQTEKVKDFPLRREDYFHGKMKRHDAEDKVKKRGDWLLRQDRGRKMMVSVRKTRRDVAHIEVGFDETAQVFNYAKNGSSKKIIYRDFEELVKSIGGKTPIRVEIDETSKRNPAAPARVPSSSKDRRLPETSSSVEVDENVDPKMIVHERTLSRPQTPIDLAEIEETESSTRRERKTHIRKSTPAQLMEKPKKKVEAVNPVIEQSDQKDPEDDEFLGSISAIFGGDEEDEEEDIAPVVRQEEKISTSKPPEVHERKHPPALVLDDDSNDEYSDFTEPKASASPQLLGDENDATELGERSGPLPRKRSADQSALTVNQNKQEIESGRRTPEARRPDKQPPAMEEVEPAWFEKLSQQEQTDIVSYFTNCVQRLTNGGKVITDDVYESMEDKFSLSKSKTRDLHLFLIGEPLPKGTSDLEATDHLGRPKRAQTSLTAEEFSSVEAVFNTLALDHQGIEAVSFRTLVGHFQVPISDEEIDSLFGSMEQDDEGYVTWERMVTFLQRENIFDQEVENNRLVLIASIKNPDHQPPQKKPPTPQQFEPNSREPMPSEKTNQKELPELARNWLIDAKNKLTEKIPQRKVPGGFTKHDLLQEYEDLFELPANEAKDVLVQKLNLCCVQCDFRVDTSAEKMYRKKKQDLLLNISQYVSETKKWFSEAVLKAMKDLVMYNIFRSLPYKPPDVLHDPDDEPKLDLAWEHLHSCYEILLRLVIAPFTKDKLVRKHLGNVFLEHLVNMFMSEDPRERDYLKVILHRFYGKFLKPRPHIRRTMHEMLYSFIHDFPFLPGVCEILEILGSIINGFSIPLKDEHKDFLRNVLIPLHKAPVLMDFSAQLNYCITQFVAKDPSLTPEILAGLLKYWPIQSSQKEVLFLTEIEAILEIVEHDSLDPVVEEVFNRLGKCMCSVHFQVAEQALNLTANETISYYITRQRQRIVPILYPYLQKNLRSHWHDTVRSVTVNILATLREMDGTLYKKIVLDTKQERKKQEEAAETREDQWAKLIRHYS